MRAVMKKIEDFLTLLHSIGKSGTASGDTVEVPLSEVKLTKSKCGQLKKFGLDCELSADTCSVRSAAYPDLAVAWTYLGTHTDSILLFSHAVFGNPDEYAFELLNKLLRENQPNLVKYLDYFKENGYRFTWGVNKSFEIFGFDFRGNVSGFNIHFDRRFHHQLDFNIINHINYKTMLENFENQTETLQAFMVRSSRRCSECLKCTKGNPKVSLFFRDVEFHGETYRLCPSFPRFDWKQVDDELMEQIIECIAMQERA